VEYVTNAVNIAKRDRLRAEKAANDTIISDYKNHAAALLRDPDDPVALLEQFSCLLRNGKPEDAPLWRVLAARARANAHPEINTVFNHATALNRAGMAEEAIAEYEYALKLAPDDTWRARVLESLGVTHAWNGGAEAAIKLYRQALEIEPDNPHIKSDLAIATLKAGRLNEGLRLHEVRREIAELNRKTITKAIGGDTPNPHQGNLPKGVVHWQGEPLSGKTITVYHEEGVGDFIMWARFLPHLKILGPREIYLTGKQPGILELVKDNFPNVVNGIDPLADAGKTDFVVGSLTFPWRCGVEYEDVTGEAYFSAMPAKIYRRGKLNVGLVWRGNPGFARDYLRSMPFREFIPLFDLVGVAFYSLQIGEAAAEVDQTGFTGFVADLAPQCKDWRATASLIAALDVVVTVDTAIAHLAGALGKPVITLVISNNCWRWPREGGTPRWYDSMTVLRQQKMGDWSGCIKKTRKLLERRRGELKEAA
jgi:tetratricopeptide (TPR) repeat protein